MKRKAHFIPLVSVMALFALISCGKQNQNSSSAPSATSNSEPTPSSSSSTPDSKIESNPSSSEEITVQYDFTFDLNYEGSTPIVVKVDEGATVSPIDEPQREGFLFQKWMTEATDGEEFDFTTAINADTTVYALWQEIEEENVVSVTFHWNIPDVANTVIKVEKGKRITLPTTKDYPNHLFRNWYTDEALTTRFAQTTKIQEAMDLYARYDATLTMEAEYTDLDEKPGRGYSANVEGVSMISRDVNNAGASNGFFVSYLYYNGAFLQFDFDSSDAVSDASIVLRLSVEFYDMELDADSYVVEVNGVALSGYSISLSGAISIEESETDKRPFENYKISEAVSLKKGSNTIKLITNNGNYHGGTMGADAPIVDCVYLSSSSDLSWSPITSNVDGK